MEKQPDEELGTGIGRCPNVLRYQEDMEIGLLEVTGMAGKMVKAAHKRDGHESRRLNVESIQSCVDRASKSRTKRWVRLR